MVKRIHKRYRNISNIAKEFIQKYSTSKYVSQVLKLLDEEKVRQAVFLNKKFHEKINSILYKEIIGENMIELINRDDCVKFMLENKRYEELSKLYDFFKLY